MTILFIILRSLYATTPGPSSDRAVKNAEDLSATAKTWSEGANIVSFDESPDDPPTSRSLRSGASSGGWHIPDDTDLASGYDWNQRVKGGPPRDPRGKNAIRISFNFSKNFSSDLCTL
ncbi:hypothetical protein PoB_001597100 [Plakobranchus ocellatus]|uniref:Uncharacterized protein n=1 Tax=Plakobranchus ocellatus TaxID=259542 RepID=A0AAV3YQQ0_9GAST|nr:hypothetical protein PoB_001597100 [Plakobranchus ocellatus]